MEGNLKKPEQRRDFLEIASGFFKLNDEVRK